MPRNPQSAIRSPQLFQALAVAAAALGYFVDLYDIVIFGVVRVASLTELGITGAANTEWGVRLFNLQMAGMLVGGFFWGVIGDKLGRRFALLSTITLYSLANLANGFVTSVEQYAVLRVLAGIGLAGELGAGITLVSELLPKNLRGYGTTVISFLGLVGALTAALVGGSLDWRVAYIVGGVLGLAVLGLRIVVLRESAMFEEQKAQHTQRGDLRVLLRPTLAVRFLAVVAVGVPIWYVSALFVTLAPEYGKALDFNLRVADVLLWQASGLAIGSALSGLASEWLGSRKRVLYLCLAALAVLVPVLMRSTGVAFYCTVMLAIGLAQGYWTAYITMATEQFGTNIRATVSTAVPNIVRALGAVCAQVLLVFWPLIGLVPATLGLGAVVLGLAFVSLRALRETHGSDLNYAEH